MKLSDEEFVITAKADQMYMNLSEDSGIEIRSDKTIQVKAGGNIAAQSATKVELKAKDKLYIVGGMCSLSDDTTIKTISAHLDEGGEWDLGGVKKRYQQ